MFLDEFLKVENFSSIFAKFVFLATIPHLLVFKPLLIRFYKLKLHCTINPPKTPINKHALVSNAEGIIFWHLGPQTMVKVMKVLNIKNK